jgi:hypothetical protein
MDIKFGWCYRKKKVKKKKAWRPILKIKYLKMKLKIKINFIKKSKKIQSQPMLTFKTYCLIKKIDEWN